MPKQIPQIPNSDLLAKLGDRAALSDKVLLLPSQVGLILGRSTDQLADDRNAGRPPPFTKDKGSIRYPLGVLRDYLDSMPLFNNTTQARLAAQSTTLGFPSFAAWVSDGKADDLWPCLIRPDHGPMDFFESLRVADQLDDASTCEFLRLDDYFKLRRRAAWKDWFPAEPVMARAEMSAPPQSEGDVSEIWAAANVSALVDAAREKGLIAHFEHAIMVRYLGKAFEAYAYDEAASRKDSHIELDMAQRDFSWFRQQLTNRFGN